MARFRGRMRRGRGRMRRGRVRRGRSFKRGRSSGAKRLRIGFRM